MTASISHEIRNPLGIIKSSAELLKKKIDQLDPSNPIPGIIVEEASRLNGIITDFLNYARPHQPDLQPGHIEPVLEKILVHLASEMETRQIAISKNIQTTGRVLIDSDMLYQAILNLIINAMQAMETDGHLDIALTEKNGQAILMLHDTGPGIDGHILEKIWDPFFTNKEKGTGLGLGIVKKIIEAHDGQISISNAAIGGAVVQILLPLYQET
jgi:signal transduction histidine kinase